MFSCRFLSDVKPLLSLYLHSFKTLLSCVCRLWGHLLERANKWGIESGLKNHRVSFTSPGNSDRDSDPRTGNTDLMDDLLVMLYA